jgi:hypothetical protein
MKMCNRFDISVRAVENNTMFKKLRILVSLPALVALIVAPALHGAQDEPVLKWHTYAGSFVDDHGADIAVDPSGNIYLAGWSDETWGNPINPHSGGRDAYVAKLNSTGGLVWNTFLGSSETDEARTIAVDGSGNVYVVGWSRATWGSPINPHSRDEDAFVARLDPSGVLLWNLFIGAARSTAVAVDASGNVYVTGWTVNGWSNDFWGTPVAPPAVSSQDAFAAKLNSSGIPQWSTFIAGDGAELGTGIAVDATGHVYVSGRSDGTWGTPINGHAGDMDAFVAKLDSSGFRQWNTFMGSSASDGAWGIAVDGSGNVYVVGWSDANWGAPVNPHGGGGDEAFAAKLDSSGVPQWHTFTGAGSYGWDIAVDGGQNVYLTGGAGGFVAALNRDGVLQWSTYLEAVLYSIALDRSRNVHVAGSTPYSWGTPVNPWAGGWDAFVAKIGFAIEIVNIDIKPDGFPNSINLRSRGTVPVAILSSPTFDASTVDASSVTLAGAAVELKGRGIPMTSLEDVNGDGLMDLILHIATEALTLTGADTEAVLEGRTTSGQLIRGVETVRIVP